jgi:hypothetical protein
MALGDYIGQDPLTGDNIYDTTSAPASTGGGSSVGWLTGLTSSIDNLASEGLSIFKSVNAPTSLNIPGVGVYIPGQGYVSQANPATTQNSFSMFILIAIAAVIAIFAFKK